MLFLHSRVIIFDVIINFPALCLITFYLRIYEGHLESKERFAIQRYLLIIGKKQNMQVL